MNSWRDWILPGVIVVALLSALSTYLRMGEIESSLTSNTSQMLAEEFPWASIATDGRDVTISGSSPSNAAMLKALRTAEQVYGVRVAKDGAALPDFASPYLLTATKRVGRIELSGNVLNSGMRARVIDTASGAYPEWQIEDGLVEARGEPDGFEAFAGFGFEQLDLMEEGRFELQDKLLSLSGVAASHMDYDTMFANLSGDLPDGLEIGAFDITPPRASPYAWRADLQGGRLVVEGFAPDPATRQAMIDAFNATLPGVRVDNKLQIAAGAPEGFKSAVNFATSLFGNLSVGSVELVANEVSIAGTARDKAAFADARLLMETLPEGYVLATNAIKPMVVQNFVWGLSKTEQGIIIDGVASDQAEADANLAMVREATGVAVVTDRQSLGSGEPANFQKAREFAADLMKLLEGGTARVEGSKITLSGQAVDADALGLLERAMNLRVPEGFAGVLNVSVPDTVVIKGKEVKLDNVPTTEGPTSTEEPELTEEQLCENDMKEAVNGRKIQFEIGKAIIKAASRPVLDSVFAAMENSCERFPIQIGGHTDSDGNEAYNQRLSEKRATAVARYLLAKGLKPERLSAIGFGETSPIANNNTRDGKAANRRIEFKVIN